MKRFFPTLALATVIGLFGSLELQAQSGPVRDKNVEAELLVASSTIVAGEPVQAALRLRIDPTWHTYWINPGTAGKKTELKLSLPPGFGASELAFPTPKKFVVDYGYGVKVVGFGYEKDVVHPFILTPPSDLQAGQEIVISGRADWLMCDPNTCIPGKAELSVKLVVADSATPTPEASMIEHAFEKLPSEPGWPIEVKAEGGTVTITTTLPDPAALPDGKATFYPLSQNVLNILEEPTVTTDGTSVTITSPVAELFKEVPEPFSGLLSVIGPDGEKTSFLLTTAEKKAEQTPEKPGQATDAKSETVTSSPSTGGPFGGGLLGMLLAAFLGGIILNVMPCVFPVISLKVMSFIGQAGEDKKKILAHSLVFALGIFVFFWILTVALLAIRSASGGEVSWGVQLQQPGFVIAMIFVMVAVALSLFGLIEFGTSLQGVGGNLAHASGYAGSFWSGALAVLLATPCTAPLMAPAIAFALAQPAPLMFLVFTTLAFGLAFPYLLLAAFPGLLNRIPPPGKWMETFKQFMGFPMLAVAVWLIGVISAQLEVAGLQWALAAVLLLAMSLWVIGRFAGFEVKPSKRLAARIVALLLFAGSIGLAVHASGLKAEITGPDIADVIAQKRSEGKNVFVDFTAKWCVNCQLNKRIAIHTKEVETAFAENNIELVTADFTNEDPRIGKILKEHGRAGVPLYLLYPADKSQPAIQLPDGLIRPSNVFEAIEKLPK